MSVVEFYHYTNDHGKNAILSEGIIRPSNGATDAMFGPGVYGTGLSPHAGKRMIAWNNWEGLSSRRALDKATWAFRLFLPAHLVQAEGSKRDVLRYTGGNIILSNVRYDVLKV